MWGTFAAAAVAGLAGLIGSLAAASDAIDETRIGLGVLVLLAGAVALARRRRTAPAVVLTAAGVGALFSLTGYVLNTAGIAHPGATLLLWFGMSCALVGLVAALGFRDRALAVGGAVGAVLVAAWAVMQVLGVQTLHTAAWMAIGGVALLGVLPGIAMAASGLTGLDDRVVEGQRVARPAVERAVDATHRSLTAATVAAVIPLTAAAWLLARTDEMPAQALAAAVGLILLMRTQVLPLAPQRLALLAGGTTALATLAFTQLLDAQASALVALVLVAALAAIVGVRFSENTRARLRRFAGIVEMVAVIALLPLTLWYIGLFHDLIGTFTS